MNICVHSLQLLWIANAVVSPKVNFFPFLFGEEGRGGGEGAVVILK